jgi:hypothetical protein
MGFFRKHMQQKKTAAAKKPAVLAGPVLVALDLAAAAHGTHPRKTAYHRQTCGWHGYGRYHRLCQSNTINCHFDICRF